MKLNLFNKGLSAEKAALEYLQKQGLKLVVQNYHCRYGEIDLIMQEGETLVFVEVRQRSNKQFGAAAESITPQKQRKLITTAMHYCIQAPNQACRFDAVLIEDVNCHHLSWLRNAFSA